MINTIFYFVNDFDTYKQKLDNNEILAKTIVFVEDQKAIYKNGVRYGSMSDADFRNKVTEVMNSDTVIQGLINEIYDDQWIRDWMAQVNQTITSEQNRLSGVITDLDADIQTKVEDMFEDAQWVLDNVVNNLIISQSNFGEADVQSYLLRIGMWDYDDNGGTVTKWSTIRQDVSNIQASVNALSSGVDGRFTALDSSLKLYTDTHIQTAVAELSTTYATGTDLDDVKTVLEWMYSGLKSSAGPDKSVAQIITAGKSELLNQMGISELRTFVENVPEQGYVATNSLQSQVELIMNNTTTALVTAGLINQASLAGALSALYARSEQPENQIAGWSQLMLDVSTGNDGQFVTKAGLITSIGNNLNATNDPNGDNMAVLTSAGIVAQSTLDTSVAALFALNNNSGTKAAITAIAEEEASKVEITGDVIDARVNLLLVSGNGTFNGTVQAKLFIAGEDGKPGIVVQAGNFDPNGADTTKAYFAYDTRQHASSIFIYDPNESGGKWKSLSFANAFVADNYYPVTYALYVDTNNIGGIGSIPSNITSISASNFSTTSLYYSNLDRNTYVVENDPDPTNLAVGNYLKNTSIYKGVGAPANNYFMLYLGIHNNYFIVAAIQIEVFTTDYVTYSNSSDTTSITNVSGKDVIYSSDAVTNCTINSDGEITNVSRGGCFLKGIRKLSTRHQSGLTVTDSDIDVVDKGWDPSTPDPDPVSNNNGRSLKTDVDECIGKVLMPNGDVYDITPYSTDRSLATGTQNSYWRTHGVDFVGNDDIILMFDKATDLGDSGYRNTYIGTSLTSANDNTRRWGTRVAHYIDLSRFTQTAPSKDYLRHSSTDEGLWEDMTYEYTATAAA